MGKTDGFGNISNIVIQSEKQLALLIPLVLDERIVYFFISICIPSKIIGISKKSEICETINKFKKSWGLFRTYTFNNTV